MPRKSKYDVSLVDKYTDKNGKTMNTGERIKYYREQCKLTQKQLEATINMSIGIIYIFENGKRKKTTIDVIEKIAKALNVDIELLTNYNVKSLKEMSVNERINYYRKLKGLSRQELADKTGLAPNTISHYERTDEIIRPFILFNIANALNINVLDLSPSMNIDVKQMNLAEKIRYYRNIQGLTPTQFENKIGNIINSKSKTYKMSTYSQYYLEEGNKSPNVYNINLVAEALNVSVKDLVDLYVTHHPYTQPLEIYEKDTVTNDITVKYVSQPYLLPNMTMGERIRYYRKQQELSQRDLEKKSGVSYAYISNLETGKHTNARLSFINKLAQALNVDACQLFEFYTVDEQNYRNDEE